MVFHISSVSVGGGGDVQYCVNTYNNIGLMITTLY